MRLEGWEERLAEYVEAQRATAFAWGKTDCAMFASDAVLALTGSDPFAEYRGRYSTETEAERLIDEAGGFEALCTRLLGEPKPVACARRGDLVFGPLRPDGAEGLAVVVGALAVTPGYSWKPIGSRLVPQQGLVFLKVGKFRHAYSVG